jgi:hypothetical protein
MKLDWPSLKEACIDTFLGLPINWFLSYAVLATMLFLAFDNAHYKRINESVQD